MSEAAQDLGEAILNNIRTPAPEPEASVPKRGTSAGRLIDPPKEDEVLVTYPDTLDGFVAAWVVRKVAQKHNIALEMADKAPPSDINLTGRNWIIVGDVIEPAEIGSTPKSGLRIKVDAGIDAITPLPFKKWERTFPFGIKTMTESTVWANVSGSSLAAATWDFFYADRKGFDSRPRFIDYLNDSLTKNRFGDTDAVLACAESYPHNFRTFDQFIEACDDRKRLAYVIAGGQAILRYKELHKAATD